MSHFLIHSGLCMAILEYILVCQHGQSLVFSQFPISSEYVDYNSTALQGSKAHSNEYPGYNTKSDNEALDAM